MNRLVRSICAGMSLALLGAAAMAANNSWTLTGPSGEVGTLATHPTNPDIAVAAGSRSMYRSADSGVTWTPIAFETLNTPQQIVFDPSNPNRVVANDGLLYLSEDGGLTFQNAQSPETQNNVRRIAVAGDGTVYAATYTGNFYRSTMPLSTWTAVPRAWNLNNSPTALAVNPNNPDIMYAAVESVGVFRTDNAGAGSLMAWSAPLTNGLPAIGPYVHQLLVSPANPTHVFAATSQGLFRSTNSGAAWSQVDWGPIQQITINPANANVIIATRHIGQQSRSTDGGATFTPFGPEHRTNSPEAHFVANSPTRILYGTDRGVAISTDGGATLSYVASGIIGGNATRVVLANDGAVYLAQPSGQNDIFRRAPGVTPNYLPIDGTAGTAALTINMRLIYALAVAPTHSDVVFAVNSVNQLLRTFDRGANFTPPHSTFTTGSNTDYITDVQIAPKSTPGIADFVAYVARTETGVWKTTNSGGTFTQLANSPAHVVGLAIHPANPSVIYAGGGISDGSGIYKSSDGGATWAQQQAPGVLTNRSFNAFAFDPVDEDTVYALSWGGVLKTVDGGAHWTEVDFHQLSGNGVPASAMLIDPVYPTTMIMVNSGANTGFLRTVDGGATWSETQMNLPGRDFVLYRAVSPSIGHLIAASGTGVAEYTVAPDLSVSMSSTPTTFALGTTQAVTFSINNNGVHDSSASELTITFPTWLTPVVPSDCTRSGQTLRCTFGVLRAHTAAQVTVQFAVGGPLTGTQLSAEIEGHEVDSEPGNDRVDRAVNAAEIVDLDLTLAAAPSTIDHGAETEVLATLINRGPSPATNAAIDFTGLASFTMVSTTPSLGTCSGTAPLTCNLGTIAANGTITVRLRLAGSQVGAHSVTGQARATGPDSDNDQNSASQVVTVRPVGDMSLTVTESADPVVLDAPLQYVATVRHLSGDGAPSTLSLTATGITINGVSTSDGSCTTTGGQVNCSFAAAATATVTIDVGTAVPGIATLTGLLTYSGTDTNPANNPVYAGTTIRRTADLSVSLVRSTAATSLNTEYTHTATVRNDGPNAASARLLIPVAAANVLGVSGNGGICTTTTNSVDCNHTQLASAGSWEIVVRVSSASPAQSTATATVSSDAFDPDSSDNQASADVLVSRVGDLSVTLTESTDPATTGAPFSYTATLSNLGPNAGEVQITVPVTGATVTGATPSVGICTTSASQVDCQLGSLNSGTTATLRIDVNANIAGTAQATATVTLLMGTDPVTTNNSATISTTVNTPPPSGGGGGGGGGGGRFDWLVLGALAALISFGKRRRIPARTN